MTGINEAVIPSRCYFHVLRVSTLHRSDQPVHIINTAAGEITLR